MLAGQAFQVEAGFEAGRGGKGFAPQAQTLGMMYMLLAFVMIFGWVQLLRRSARLAGAVALPHME